MENAMITASSSEDKFPPIIFPVSSEKQYLKKIISNKENDPVAKKKKS